MQTRPCALGLRFLIYVKEAAASGIAKKQKSPCVSRENFRDSHTGFLFCWRDGRGVYAEKICWMQILIDMICSDFWGAQNFHHSRISLMEGKEAPIPIILRRRMV